RTEAHHFDEKLSSITVRSKDGFAFNLDVSQIIHVGALDAPKVISRVGSMQNLVDHVLQPTVGNYFRNSAQDYTVLDFLSARGQRQAESRGLSRRRRITGRSGLHRHAADANRRRAQCAHRTGRGRERRERQHRTGGWPAWHHAARPIQWPFAAKARLKNTLNGAR